MSLRAGANIWLADAPVLENPELLEGVLLGEFPATVEADLPGLKVVAGDPPARVVGTLPGLLSAIPRDGRAEGPLPGLSSYAYGESGTVIDPPEPPGVGDPGPASVDAELPSIYVVASGGEVEPEISSMFGEISALRADNMVSSRWEVGNVDEQPISGLALYAGDVGNNAARMRGELPVPLVWASAFDDFGMLFVQLPGIEGALNNNELRVVENLTAQTYITAVLPLVVSELLELQATHQTALLAGVDIDEELVVRAISIIPYLAEVVEALEALDENQVTPELAATVAELLTATDLIGNEVTLRVAVLFALTLGDQVQVAYQLSAIELLEAVVTNTAKLGQAAAVLENLILEDLPAVNLALLIETDEGITADVIDTATATLRIAVEEGVGFYLKVKVGDDVFEGWVLNAETAGFSEYTNFPFNSFASVQGRIFAASEDGVFELDGADDDGTQIDARVRTGLLDLGTHYIKDVKAVHIGFTSDDRMVLKVTAMNRGTKEEHWYEMKPSDSASMRDGRVTVQRGLRSRYWQFELVNANGADFDIDELDIQFNPLTRRLR